MEYARAGSRDGGPDRGGGAAESAELEEVLARLLEPGMGWVELLIARAMAERVELRLEPGERWIR
jgi:hypothetical protein